MRRGLTVVMALLAVASLCGSAAAFSYAEWHYGELLSAGDARSLALGGAGLASADGARGAGLNPALVAKTVGLEIAASAMAVTAEESREAPLYDSFEGVIGYNTYAFNSTLYDRYVGTIAWKAAGEYDWAPAVAIGYHPRLDMSYNYHVQYRDSDTQAEPMDRILYDYWVESDGGVNAFTVTLAHEVVPEVYLGLGVDFLRGQADAEERWVYPEYSEEEDVDSWFSSDDFSGTQFTVGLLVEKLHRVDMAVVYRAGFELAADYSEESTEDETTDGNLTYTYPSAIAVGFEYHPRNEIKTTVSLDIEYTQWSEFEDSLIDDLDLDDTIEYRVGVEHEFFNSSHARFGFLYQPSYMDEETTRAAFCVGLGLDIVGVRLDVGGQLGVREYDVEDGRIRETTTTAMATLTHRF
jgi:hypothetical protein